ncbi:hypothetical protein N7451_010735 [Penicillium sp. IBT 35674x]|nr:hypothetical protein N7451_010735 [Penicillium sp. IBT 35674x]
MSDVEKAFTQTTVPIGGNFQGAMVLRQQPGALSILSNTQLINGNPVPQPENSQLLHDARFASLFTTSGRTASGGGEGSSGGSKDVQALLLLLQSKSPDHAVQLAATVEVVNKCFVRVLRLSERIDTGRPLSVTVLILWLLWKCETGFGPSLGL